MKFTLPNCHLCGKFVGWKKDYITFTPFGHALDLEPPDEKFMHVSCYEALPENRKRHYNSTWSYIPAGVVKGSECL